MEMVVTIRKANREMHEKTRFDESVTNGANKEIVGRSKRLHEKHAKRICGDTKQMEAK